MGALVQSAVNGSGATVQPSIAKAFTSNNTLHNFLIVHVAYFDANPSTITVADTLLNSYLPATTNFIFLAPCMQIFYVPDCNAGANTVTASISPPRNFPDITVMEFSGLASSSPIDTHTDNAHATSTNPSVTNGTNTVQADDLILAGWQGSNGSLVVGGGWNGITDVNGNQSVAYKFVSSVGQFTSNWTGTSGDWVAQIVAFKATQNWLSGGYWWQRTTESSGSF